MTQIALQDYEKVIFLHEQVKPKGLSQVNKEALVESIIIKLIQEHNAPKDIIVPDDFAGKRKLMRALLNIREPKLTASNLLEEIDCLLQSELAVKQIVEVEKLETIERIFPDSSFTQSEKLILWQGDITQLKADAIVNAANSQMLGCFQPLHACIDNAIHSAAGPQLRNDCEKIMSLQGRLEETGDAKITRAYNLPSRYVLHTVGPIVPQGTELTREQRDDLASCYRACLELASQLKYINSIAFCAISTGVYGFPKTEAAYIAVNTVNQWLAETPNSFERIVFNVFSPEDYHEYSLVFSNLI
ncbi:protein-ADP-ribose hydrolase [Niallia circulans]|uniref:Protein-ADP-ribose hydrolase n=1 Tax=Niallia circulans TaxID=1397 RepID=A0A553SS75_NIACI|nr:protein-ADP-ribose hydrolase [Niallia circulans]TRZ39844.1 protein-ADP-ribose hydrolase [Niallia circulans]